MRNVNLIFQNVKSGINLFITTFILLSLIQNVNAQSNGIYESYAILSLNGGANAFYDMNATTGNPDFQGATLGSFNSANSLVVKGGQNKTFKCDEGDITGGAFYWRVWLTSAGASGSFTSENPMNFTSNDVGGCGGNQTWEVSSGSSNIISGLTVPGNYTLEVYSESFGSPTNPVTSNNGGANYKATFNYCGPSSGALPAGNYSIPGCFATVAAAVTYLNANGITGSGGVQFNVAAGHTETVSTLGGISMLGSGAAGNLCTGTISNPIIFKKSGAGANPTITAFSAPTAGLRNDAVIKIIGGDYLTFDGITLQENSGNTTGGAIGVQRMTEMGIGIFAASTTNGAQNNTIQNCTITLSTGGAYQNAIGIFSSSSSSESNGAQVATTTAGTNSNNKIYGNTISGVAYGIYVICPGITATLFETGWDIGGTAIGTANNVTFGNATTADIGYTSFSGTLPTGIYFRNGVGNNVRFNSITSNSLAYAQSAGLGGIMYVNSAPTGVTYTSTISDNTINLTNIGTTAITGVDFGYGISTGTIVGSNNTITINQTAGAAVSTAITGIKANYTSATNTVNSNTIVIEQSNSTGSTTSAVTGINCAGVGTIVNVQNNPNITIKQSVSGVGSFGSGAITFINVSAASGTINVVNNGINTTGSTIRSSGTLIGVNQDATVTVLVNVKSNTFNVDRVATSGTSYFQFTSGTPSEVADTISSNIITFTSLAGTSVVTAINSGGGPSTPALNNKNINNNTINISGTNTGTCIGINQAFTNTGFLKGNSVTISTASPTVTGITTSSTAVTMSGNSLSLTSSTTSPTAMTGLAATSTAGGHSITNNTFTTMNFSGIITGSPTISGISISGGTLANVFNNTVTSINVGAATSSANPVVDGILVSGGVSVNVFKNKIYGITSNCTGATGVVNGIRISGGGTTGNNYFNNLIGSLNAPASTNPDGVRGISITSTTVTTTNNVYYNTVYLSGGGGTNFGSSGIFHTANATATTATLNLRNNIIVNATTPNGSGFAVAFRRSGAALNNYASTSNNNDFYAGATTSSPFFIYYDGTGYQIAGYKTLVTTRDNASFSEDPEFQSTTGSSADFLKFKVSSSKQAESGAVNIATYTDDFAATIRQGNGGYAGTGSAPDIGAWELEGISPAPRVNTVSIAPIGNQCTNVARTVTANVTPVAPLTTVTLNYSVDGVPQTPVNMTGGMLNATSDWTGTIPTVTPANGAVTWNVVATDGTFSGSKTGTGYTDEPLTGVSASIAAVPSTLCAGGTTTLTASITKPGSVSIGAGASTSSSTAESFFPGAWGGAKTQYIILGTELMAQGLKAGDITALAFEPTTAGQTYQGFFVNIGSTAQSSMTSSFITTGLTDVYAGTLTNNGFLPVANTVNTLTFGTGGTSSAFNWNGSSNIVVSISWSSVPNASTSTSSTMKVDAPGFTCSAYDQQDNVSPAVMKASISADGTGTRRPKFIFTGNTAPTMSSFAWTDGTNTAMGNPANLVIATVPATVTLTATDANGCTLTPTTPIAASAALSALNVTTSATTLCGGVTANLTATPVDGCPGYTYAWSATPATGVTFSNPNISNPTFSAVPSPATQTMYTLTCVVTDAAANMVSNNSIVITVDPKPTASATSNSPVCVGGTLNVDGSTSVIGATYLWTGPNGALPATEDLVINPVAIADAGTYNFTVTLNGCTSTTAMAVVTVNPIPSLPTAGSNSPVCQGSTLNLSAANIFVPYSVTNNSGISFIDINASGTAVTGVLGDDSEHNLTIPSFTFNNIAYTTARVGVNGLLVFGSNSGDVTFSNAALPSTSNTAGNIFIAPFWDDMDINLSGTIKTETVGSKYIVQFTNIDHNSFTTGGITFQIQLDLITSQIHLVYQDVIFGSATYDSGASSTIGIQYSGTQATQFSLNTASLSNGQSITFTPAPGSYSWEGPNSFSSLVQNPSISNITLGGAGTYTVTVTNPITTCTNTSSTIVVVNALPTATISYAGNPFCKTGTTMVTQTGQGGGSYASAGGLSINIGTGDVDLGASTSGAYTVTYSFTDGTCPNTTTAPVQIEGTVVKSAADAGFNTLRSVYNCIGEGGTITYDQPTTATTILTSTLDITKSVTIEGLSMDDRPEITLPAVGMDINASKVLSLKNVDIKYTGTNTFTGTGEVIIIGDEILGAKSVIKQ